LANFLNWLREVEPDIVCLQELKAPGAEFPADAIRQAGYHAVWRGEKRWNGVAILARRTPVVTRMDLPGDASDGHAAISRQRSTLARRLDLRSEREIPSPVRSVGQSS
jgi:exodeoxyribonuclease-3